MTAGETVQAFEAGSIRPGTATAAPSARVCSVAIVASARVEHELVAATDVPAQGFAGGELEHGTGALLPGHPPRAHLRPDGQHAEVPVEEQHVDGKPHE